MLKKAVSLFAVELARTIIFIRRYFLSWYSKGVCIVKTIAKLNPSETQQ